MQSDSVIEHHESPMKVFPKLGQQDKKGSGRFSFRKMKQDDHQIETQTYKERIKQQMKGKLQLIINKPSEQGNTVELQQQLTVMLRKLDLDLSPEDCANIIPSTQKFNEDFEVLETLGEGCLGLVKRVQSKITKQLFAVKIVSTSDEEVIRNMLNEFTRLLHINHDNIVKMHKLYIDYSDAFQSESKALILMELIEGQEMFEQINELGHYSEIDARELFKQLLNAIEYMHRRGICHRDLKPHNILCVKDKKQIKVTDFNVSKFSENYKEFSDLNDVQKIEMWTYTGTVAFSAPEIFTGEGYNQMVDMWSAGCILYTMLSGQLPFSADYLNDLIEQIKHAKYTFPEQQFEGVSENAKDLIRELLQKNWEDRLTPDAALSHPWFIERSPVQRKTLKQLTLKNTIRQLSFRGSDKDRTRMRTLLVKGRIMDSIQQNKSQDLNTSLEPPVNVFNSAQELRYTEPIKSKFYMNKKSSYISNNNDSVCQVSPDPDGEENTQTWVYQQQDQAYIKTNQGDVDDDIEFNAQQ